MVRRRAGFLCEYCHTVETWQLIEFTIDHVIPLSLGGSDDPGNLALACFHCNRRKSNNIFVLNMESGSQITIFDPRKMIWQEHFIWSADLLYIEALTEIGAVTIEHLSLNRERLIHLATSIGP